MVQIPQETEAETKREDEEKKDSSTQVKWGREEKDLMFQNIFRCVECTMDISIYR